MIDGVVDLWWVQDEVKIKAEVAEVYIDFLKAHMEP